MIPLRTEKREDSFHFKKRKEGINWRLLSGISIERIIKDVDIQALQESIENITFCDIENEDLRSVDPNFVKLFRLSQLIIEYLLFSQDQLVDKSKRLKESGLNEKISDLQQEVQDKTQRIEILNRENRQLKKAVQAFQLWTKIPGGLNHQPLATSYHRCRYCSKVFNSDYYLENHLSRRHPEKPNYVAEDQNIPPAMNFVPPMPAFGMESEWVDKLTGTIEKFSNKVMETERVIRQEMEMKFNQELLKREQLKEQSFQQDNDKELRELKSLLSRQLEEEKELLMEERRALEQLKREKPEPVINESEIMQKLDNKVEDAFNKLANLLMNQQGSKDDKVKSLENEKNNLDQQLRETNRRLLELEQELYRQRNPVAEPKPVVEKSTGSTDMWPAYKITMESFGNNCSKKYNLKSCYVHDMGTLTGKNNELQVQLEYEYQKRGLVKEKMENEEHVKELSRDLKKASLALDERNSYAIPMRHYLNDQLETIVKKFFRLKPLKPLLTIQTQATIPLPDKQDYFRMAGVDRIASPSKESLYSVRSYNSEVGWDDRTVSEISSEESLNETEPSVPATPLPQEQPAAKRKFSFDFNIFRRKSKKDEKNQPAVQKTERILPTRKSSALELDPALFNAVGHIPDSKKKQPLDSIRKSSQEELEISDLSDSEESSQEDLKISRPISRGIKKIPISALEEDDFDDDLETDFLN